MTFSYTGPNGAGVFPTLKDNVRFLSEDTVSSSQSVSDEEIAYLLVKYSNDVTNAAAAAVDLRAGKYSSLSSTTRKSKKVGDLSLGDVDYSSMTEYLRGLADRLRSGGAGNDGIPAFQIGLPATSDRDQVFWIGQNDYPGTSDRYVADRRLTI